MKTIILALALLLVSPFTTVGAPIPAPGIEIISEGCSPCAAGDRAVVVLRVENPGAARGAQLVALLRHPNGEAVYPLRGHGDVLPIPPGDSVLMLADFTVRGGDPGAYLVEAALVDPVTGVTLARHTIGVVRQ